MRTQAALAALPPALLWVATHLAFVLPAVGAAALAAAVVALARRHGRRAPRSTALGE